MKVVALLSGGKDSCYTLLRTRQHSHTIVALAHIQPPLHVPEPDSFMYQSVASSAVETLAQAFELPLYTVRTTARAVVTQLAYTPTPHDEVEDLVTLLQKVKRAHPDVGAVCAGALWSDYQRLRVESAASRIGLLTLAYLWRREQRQLLDEMIQVGVDAILVKVAGIGLCENHLGKSLAQMRETLVKLETTYGSHVCGEGGEFETFVLWIPGMKKRVVLDQVSVVQHSHDTVAPVSYLCIERCHLENLTPQQLVLPMPEKPPVPDVFRADSELVVHRGVAVHSVLNEQVVSQCTEEETSVGFSSHFMHVVVSNPHHGREGLTRAAKRLAAVLKDNGEQLGSVIYVLLHLRAVSGTKYIDANRGYTEVFGIPECTPPPSRACVGICENNHPTTMEALVRRGRNRAVSDSFTLHVQSLSEWAPPCIGPYAQFIEEDGILHVCGVLPLYAPSASIPEHLDARRQVEACAYNLSRTLEASRCRMEQLGLFVAYVIAPDLVDTVYEAMDAVLTHGRSIAIVVPVAELPKGGLVEIRAVGTIDNNDLYKPSFRPSITQEQLADGLKCHSVSCGKLGFFIVNVSVSSESNVRRHAERLHSAITTYAPFGSCFCPLSLQIYVHEGVERELDIALGNLFPRCAVSVTRSPWMPQNAAIECIATFATCS